jgi:SAM-dependent methyltransferase
MKSLLDCATLELSSVVANSTMNRERGCSGGNSYTKDLFFDVLSFLEARCHNQPEVGWLDLCCGRGKALIEAAHSLAKFHPQVRLKQIGFDLVSMFDDCPPFLSFLQLLEFSVSDWQPDCQFDLITCVHGLHYVGDKLGMISKAASCLKPDGVFLANLDPNSLKFPNGKSAGRRIVGDLRRASFKFIAAKHLLRCEGRREFNPGFEFLGADDAAGPNYTGQAAVDSYYQPIKC